MSVKDGRLSGAGLRDGLRRCISDEHKGLLYALFQLKQSSFSGGLVGLFIRELDLIMPLVLFFARLEDVARDRSAGTDQAKTQIYT